MVASPLLYRLTQPV
jgi:two-component system cell cycle response regulator CpdR